MSQRYSNTPKIAAGSQYGTATAHNGIRRAVQQGQISTREYVLKEGERLDTIAGRVYGNARLWWIIAAASGIGWPLQVPPGTQLLIPTDLRQAAQYA